MNRNTLFLLFIVALLGGAGMPAFAAKTDTVVLINGDAVTGEIKSLEFGSLSYSTDSMGTVNIDWEDVVSLSSKQALQIEVTDGTRYFGELLTSDDGFELRVKTASEEISVPAETVVRMTPIDTDERLVSRLEGSFSIGLQAQKSSEVTTSNLSSDLGYRARQYLFGLRLNSAVTDQPNEPTKARQSAGLNYQRFRQNRWFTEWFTSWEKNDELGINARSALGGAVGRYLVQTNKNQFSITAGAQGARTSFTGEDESETQAEGRIEVRYLHRNLQHDAALTFTTKIYPLLEDFGQYRAESDLSVRREIIDDLYFELKLGHSYLSEPPADAASTDYALTTSVGYSF